VNPCPPEDLLRQLYQDLGADYFTLEAKLILDFDSNRYWREISAIPKQIQHGRLLDVGCATGAFLLCASKHGFTEVKGIDISVSSVEYANKIMGKPVAIAEDFLKQPFHSDEFDVVTLWVTLEHLTKPESFLNEAHRVLKRKGVLCLSVPNRNGLAMRLLGPRYSMVHLEHLNYFTPGSLKLLLKRVGFKTLNTRTYLSNPILLWKDYQGRHLSDQIGQCDVLADQRQNVELRKNLLVRLLQRTIDFVVSPLGIGDLLIIVAQKV
jgi:ubiquinone/menaquinone biosynthesis C-methylase UbiE